MIDAVLSVHLNPIGCGVAKWNAQLASRLYVPLMPVDAGDLFHHPLVSIRLSEAKHLRRYAGRHDVMLHDVDGTPTDLRYWVESAETVYAANYDIACAIAPIRPDAVVAFCPGTVQGDGSRGFLDILCFGMAHRFHRHYFEQLKTVLSDRNYTISLSTAIHEGRSWDADFTQNMDLMRDVFGDRLRCLGFLADDGLRRLLQTVSAVALFFEPGVRSNNTSFWSVMDAGIPVITNLDAGSPPELKHGVNVFDIHQMTEWPQADQRRVQRWGAVQVAKTYGWDHLIALLGGKVPA